MEVIQNQKGVAYYEGPRKSAEYSVISCTFLSVIVTKYFC